MIAEMATNLIINRVCWLLERHKVLLGNVHVNWKLTEILLTVALTINL